MGLRRIGSMGVLGLGSGRLECKDGSGVNGGLKEMSKRMSI